MEMTFLVSHTLSSPHSAKLALIKMASARVTAN